MPVLSTIQDILSLGLTPLPVAPRQSGVVNKDGKLIFTGKNPSYIDAKGIPQIVHHKDYTNNPPTQFEFDLWFQSPNVGVGALGSDSIVFVDIDVKNFKSQQHCDDMVAEWLNTYPQLQSCWREQTRSGGYRLVIRLNNPPTFTNFKFAHYDHHCGEVIGSGRFAVIYPTQGYHRLTDPNVVDVESLQSIGILPTKQSTDLSTQAVDFCKEGEPIQIMDQVNDVVKNLLNGNETPNDRSKALTTIIKELYGWKNYLANRGQTVAEDIDGIIQRYAYTIDVPRDKVERIYASINLNKCQPSKAFYEEATFDPPHRTAEKNITAYLSTLPNPPRYNTITQSLEYVGKTITKASLDEFREILYLAVGEANERKVKLPTKEFNDTVVGWAIANNYYNPIAEYIKNLVPTDSDALDKLTERMGITADERVYLTKWMLQAVERSLNPGCDAPYMLVFYGAQGCGKTSTLQILSKGWYTGLNPMNSAGKDGLMQFHRGWFICNDELSTLSKYDIETYKTVITNPIDSVRLPYRADVENLKRPSVLCGTTNNAEFLKDATGNRRFLVIHFRNTFTVEDRKWLANNIDRLWGHILYLKHSGMDYHLTAQEEAKLSETQKNYRLLTETDELVISTIQWWLSCSQTKGNPISVAHVAALAQQLGVKLTAQRISKVLKGLGFVTDRIGRAKNIRTIVVNPNIANEFCDIPISERFNYYGLPACDDNEQKGLNGTGDNCVF